MARDTVSDTEPDTELEPQAERFVHGTSLHEVVVLKADEEEVAEEGEDKAAIGSLGEGDDSFTIFIEDDDQHSDGDQENVDGPGSDSLQQRGEHETTLVHTFSCRQLPSASAGLVEEAGHGGGGALADRDHGAEGRGDEAQGEEDLAPEESLLLDHFGQHRDLEGVVEGVVKAVIGGVVEGAVKGDIEGIVDGVVECVVLRSGG